MSPQVVAAIAVFVIAYVLIATEKVPRATVALCGAAAMVLIGATTGETVFFSANSGIDWNVIFLLLGMMMIVGVVRHCGLFEFLAIWAIKAGRGHTFRVLALLVVVTAVVSALLDNVTTILLIVPVTMSACQRLRVPVEPFLISEVMASNIGGAATLIGDPPNVIIASRAGLSFNDFIVNLLPITVVLTIAFLLVIRLLFHRTLHSRPQLTGTRALSTSGTITDRRLLTTSLVVVGIVLAGFITGPFTGFEPSVVALMGAGLLLLLTKLERGKVFAEVEWETLLFFAGLFIMIGALVNVGIIETIGRGASALMGDNYFGGSTLLLVGSGVISGIVDNIPYVATLAPMTADIVQSGGSAAQPLWWALALGAALGGNATAIGASANVVMIGIAKRHGHQISFWRFTKYGLVVTAVMIALCIPYLWLRYYL